MLRVGAVVLNVKDARRASWFWSEALGYAYRNGRYREDTAPVLVPPQEAAIAIDSADVTHLDLHTDSVVNLGGTVRLTR